MIIGIDASRSTSPHPTGVEKVSTELIKQLIINARSLTNFEFVYYTPKKIDWLPKTNQKIIKLKRLWTLLGLSYEMLKNKPNLLFVPVHTLPFFCPQKTFRIVHDIAFLKKPKNYKFWQKIYLKFDLNRSLKICQKIFVPTNAVKQDLFKYTKINSEKIIVISHGYNFQCQVSGAQVLERKKQILYIGRLEPKKNIVNLIKAFKIFSETHPDYSLILAGKIDSAYQNQIIDLSNYQSVKDQIKFLDYISEEKKQELLSESACLILVSFEEGFGFPILEGWDFGLPVLASDIPVLREVGESACLYVDPNSSKQIATALNKIVTDKNLQTELVMKGGERLQKFSWQKTAAKYLEAMNVN